MRHKTYTSAEATVDEAASTWSRWTTTSSLFRDLASGSRTPSSGGDGDGIFRLRLLDGADPEQLDQPSAAVLEFEAEWAPTWSVDEALEQTSTAAMRRGLSSSTLPSGGGRLTPLRGHYGLITPADERRAV